jgi:hypothetical protein
MSRKPPTPIPAASERWEPIRTAAARLGRSPGHLRRLCLRQLKGQGKARLVKQPGHKAAWEVRGDVALSDAATPPGGRAVAVLEVGGIRIVIEQPCTITLSALTPAGGNETTDGPRLAGP